MDHAELQRTLNEISGYLELGMPADALETISTLPPDSRLDSGIIGVRLLVCTQRKQWEYGAELVKLITVHDEIAPRAAAGSFHLALAVEHCKAGNFSAARDSVRALSIVYPEGRDFLKNSRTLSAMWP